MVDVVTNFAWEVKECEGRHGLRSPSCIIEVATSMYCYASVRGSMESWRFTLKSLWTINDVNDMKSFVK